MRRALPVLFLLSACWVTNDEIDAARARVEERPNTPVPTPVPVPTVVPTPPPEHTGDPLPCVDAELGLDTILADDTTEATDDLDLACGTAGATERVYLYTPAQAGCHSVRAQTTGGAPVGVALFDACDANSSTACAHGDGTALVLHAFSAGMLIAVERETPGAFEVDAAPLFDLDMGSSDQIQASNADKVANPFPNMCLGTFDFGSATGGTYIRWVPEITATYEVRVSSDTMDAVLSLHRDCRYGSPEQCQDSPGGGVTEVMFVEAEAGEELMFRVASYEDPQGLPGRGHFTLRVEPQDVP